MVLVFVEFDKFDIFYRLDVYIYDYLMKKELHATAKSFMTEGKVAPDPVGNEYTNIAERFHLHFLFIMLVVYFSNVMRLVRMVLLSVLRSFGY